MESDDESDFDIRKCDNSAEINEFFSSHSGRSCDINEKPLILNKSLSKIMNS